ncbi:hypothetical protein Pan97_18360 [Bremerella volcania]|uniref:Uncharacterized protein n=1 Tax=Bremerella volcania TaxID=2527984 RepID=A0A518C6H6_9BACT|nr:hypothetical protein [Bremerella volcania]QDU74820.1 hypothetical protein Pan97_18360 [Bremerella volcania]
MARWIPLVCSLLLGSFGCSSFVPLLHHAGSAPAAPVDNPHFVPIRDHELMWEQIVDAVDTHFKIRTEQRVRVVAGQLTEGRLETYPRIGSTMLEPWHTDSTRGYEKLESTLQTIRRRCIVRVMPEQGGYFIGVEVHKEMEDVTGPSNTQMALDGVRFDGTLRSQESTEELGPQTDGWIPLCRDVLLEQRILQDILARLNGIETERPKTPFTIHP